MEVGMKEVFEKIYEYLESEEYGEAKVYVEGIIDSWGYEVVHEDDEWSDDEYDDEGDE